MNELYSKYSDAHGTVYVIVNRTGKITDGFRVLPSHVTLLNIETENAKDIEIKKFEAMLLMKVLRRVPKKQ